MIPVWKFLPASTAHALSGVGLEFAATLFGSDKTSEWDPLVWRGQHFPNRVGLAGGVDKNADHLLAWQKMGAGFAEIGTVTPLPQDPNPGKIMDRDWVHKNLWNKMGFPSHGAKDVRLNLQTLRSDLQIPVWVNLGKNRSTSADKAADDYLKVLKDFLGLADSFVINVSSPNTQGLRLLQNVDSLRPLCESAVKAAGSTPVLLKLSPDQSSEEFQSSIEVAATAGIAGFVLTNTTLHRPAGCPFPPEGGLSGQDLKQKSVQKLKDAVRILGSSKKDLLIVSVGGISTLDDAKERMDLGADLLEVYSALVFEGPRFFQTLEKSAKKLRGDLETR